MCVCACVRVCRYRRISLSAAASWHINRTMPQSSLLPWWRRRITVRLTCAFYGFLIFGKIIKQVRTWYISVSRSPVTLPSHALTPTLSLARARIGARPVIVRATVRGADRPSEQVCMTPPPRQRWHADVDPERSRLTLFATTSTRPLLLPGYHYYQLLLLLLLCTLLLTLLQNNNNNNN